jgi:hypothetical protein
MTLSSPPLPILNLFSLLQIFRPESNRLCKFFELSTLTLSLAPRGGFQGKAGFLKLPGGNASRRKNQPGLTPTSWVHAREPKWFIVRDSYFIATSGPEAVSHIVSYFSKNNTDLTYLDRLLRRLLNRRRFRHRTTQTSLPTWSPPPQIH